MSAITPPPASADPRVPRWSWPGLATIEWRGPTAETSALAAALGWIPAPEVAADLVLAPLAAPQPGSWRTVDGVRVATDHDSVWLARHGAVRLLAPRDFLATALRPAVLEFAPPAPPAPLLRPWLHLHALERGVLPVHAAAFAWRGQGHLVVGESGAGKTGVLLGFLALGAQLVAAEWPVLEPSRQEIVADSDPVRVRAWHLQSVPWVATRLLPLERSRLGAYGRAADGVARVPGFWRLARRLGRHAYSDLPPERFAPRVERAPLRRVLFARLTAVSDLRVTPLAAATAADRIVELAREDDSVLRTVAAACGSTAPRLADLDAQRRSVLHAALDGVECLVIEVPRRSLVAALAAWAPP